jgi:hypothetical protein
MRLFKRPQHPEAKKNPPDDRSQRGEDLSLFYGQSFDMTPRSCNVALNVFIGAIVSDVNQSIKRMIKVTQSITLIDLVYS